MVRQQLRARGITAEGVLQVMSVLPRHRFVSGALRAEAYGDFPLPIGRGQTISQPYMVGLMTAELGLSQREKVLEIGTGSGYQTAILAALAVQVYTVERIPELSDSARGTLEELGIPNVSFRVGDGTLGWPAHAPFDRIIVTAGAPRTPPALLDQLTGDGRMVIPVGDTHVQELMLITRQAGRTLETCLTQCIFVKLLGAQGW